jgi:GTP-binding protein
MKAVKTAYENWNFRATTGELNRIVQDAAFEKPLVRKGKPAKVRFVTQPETRPPTVVMFVNDPDLFHFSYIRYLENAIRKAHPLEGTPLRVVARRSSGED